MASANNTFPDAIRLMASAMEAFPTSVGPIPTAVGTMAFAARLIPIRLPPMAAANPATAAAVQPTPGNLSIATPAFSTQDSGARTKDASSPSRVDSFPLSMSTPHAHSNIAPPLSAPVRVEIPAQAQDPRSDIEVSIVMPCLNEALTIEGCVKAAMECFAKNNVKGEVVIGDNGSTDGSQAIATRAGARVIAVPAKGYGAALMGGFAAARGKYLIMGDSDLSYDFGESMKFIERLRAGDDLVMGNRFDVRGGGGVQPGAMPTKNRYLGNPVLSAIGRILFTSPARDFHCGLRGFTRDAYQRMDVRTPGMEFASEIVIKATLKGMKISEVPIKLHKDGRDRPPHLRPWRDGWRHLRFMLCHSPRWTLFVPGLVLLLAGVLVGGLVAFRPMFVGGVGLDAHTLVAASLAVLIGYQWVTTAMVMRVFGISSEIGPAKGGVSRFMAGMTFERGLILGLGLILAGLIPMAWVLWTWVERHFGPLDLQTTIRPMIIGATVVAVGVQTVLLSFVAAMFRMRRDTTVGA